MSEDELARRRRAKTAESDHPLYPVYNKLEDVDRSGDDFDPAICAKCGGQWFTLNGSGHIRNGEHGAITLDLNGGVTGYFGTPVCMECGSLLLRGGTQE